MQQKQKVEQDYKANKQAIEDAKTKRIERDEAKKKAQAKIDAAARHALLHPAKKVKKPKKQKAAPKLGVGGEELTIQQFTDSLRPSDALDQVQTKKQKRRLDEMTEQAAAAVKAGRKVRRSD